MRNQTKKLFKTILYEIMENLEVFNVDGELNEETYEKSFEVKTKFENITTKEEHEIFVFVRLIEQVAFLSNYNIDEISICIIDILDILGYYPGI